MKRACESVHVRCVVCSALVRPAPRCSRLQPQQAGQQVGGPSFPMGSCLWSLLRAESVCLGCLHPHQPEWPEDATCAGRWGGPCSGGAGCLARPRLLGRPHQFPEWECALSRACLHLFLLTLGHACVCGLSFWALQGQQGPSVPGVAWG